MFVFIVRQGITLVDAVGIRLNFNQTASHAETDKLNLKQKKIKNNIPKVENLVNRNFSIYDACGKNGDVR